MMLGVLGDPGPGGKKGRVRVLDQREKGRGVWLGVLTGWIGAEVRGTEKGRGICLGVLLWEVIVEWIWTVRLWLCW